LNRAASYARQGQGGKNNGKKPNLEEGFYIIHLQAVAAAANWAKLGTSQEEIGKKETRGN